MKSIKQEIVNISQKMYRDGLVAGTSGNISYYDRENKFIAITPSSIPYDLLTEEDISIMDINGNQLQGEHAPSSEWPMHRRIYEKMDHVTAIVHTHSSYATAFAVVREPIDLILIEMSAYLGGPVPLAEFAEPGSVELGDAAVEGLKKNCNCCLLSNHGVIAVGNHLEDAYLKAIYIEDAAKIYFKAKNIGAPYILHENEV